MKLLGAVLTLSLWLMVLRAAVATLLAFGLLIFVVSFIRAPGETLRVLAGLFAIGAFAAHPVAGFTLLVFLAIFSWLAAP